MYITVQNRNMHKNTRPKFELRTPYSFTLMMRLIR